MEDTTNHTGNGTGSEGANVEQLDIENQRTGSVQARDAKITNSAVGAVIANADASMESSAAMVMVAGNNLTTDKGGGALLIAGNDLNVTMGGSCMAVVGNGAKFEQSTVGVLLAGGSADLYNSRVMFTAGSAAALGAACGVVFALLSLLFRRGKKRS